VAKEFVREGSSDAKAAGGKASDSESRVEACFSRLARMSLAE
jgi:hypothetical protein